MVELQFQVYSNQMKLVKITMQVYSSFSLPPSPLFIFFNYFLFGKVWSAQLYVSIIVMAICQFCNTFGKFKYLFTAKQTFADLDCNPGRERKEDELGGGGGQGRCLQTCVNLDPLVYRIGSSKAAYAMCTLYLRSFQQSAYIYPLNSVLCSSKELALL